MTNDNLNKFQLAMINIADELKEESDNLTTNDHEQRFYGKCDMFNLIMAKFNELNKS